MATNVATQLMKIQATSELHNHHLTLPVITLPQAMAPQINPLFSSGLSRVRVGPHAVGRRGGLVPRCRQLVAGHPRVPGRPLHRQGGQEAQAGFCSWYVVWADYTGCCKVVY